MSASRSHPDAVPAATPDVVARALPGWAAFGQGRRRQAEAYAAWQAAAAARPLPCLADLAAGANGAAAIPLRGSIGKPRPPAAGVPSALLRAVQAQAGAIVAAATALGFRAELQEPGGTTGYAGILLPFADADGAVAAVVPVFDAHRLADPSDAIDHAIVAAALSSAPARPARSPWPAAAPADAAASPEARLARARMWAALALANPAGRAAALHAALDAAHALGGDPALLADMIFATGYTMEERRALAAVLERAARLCVRPDTLGVVLNHLEGGMEAFARLGGGMAPAAIPADSFRLEPLDATMLRVLARRRLATTAPARFAA